MSNPQTRGVIRGGVLGAILLPVCVIGLWLGIAALQHATASQMSQWPLGVIFLLITCPPLGSLIGVGIALAMRKP